MDPVTTVLNLTPHIIHLIGPDAAEEIPPDGPPARLTLAPEQPIGDVRVGAVTLPVVGTGSTGRVTNLPERRPGVLLIVARAVAEALPDRDDLVFPHNAVRDTLGVVVGCRAFGQVTQHAAPITRPTAPPA
jgi:hypothetical protein